MAAKKKPARTSAKKTATRSAKTAPKRGTSARSKPKANGARSARPAAARSAGAALGLRLTATSPSLTVNDIQKSLAFYRDVLGMTVKDRWEEGGKLLGVILGAGGVDFYIAQDDWKKGKDRQKGVGFRIFCRTDQNVDDLARQVTARGAVLDQEPKDQEWGRDFALTDPDGVKITIVNEKKKKR